MRNLGKRNVLGVLVDAVDYEAAVERTIQAAIDQRGFAVSALAVHGVMTAVSDRTHRYRLNHLDLVMPDGQPVRWALNLLYGMRLTEQVRGTDVMLRMLQRASAERLPVYLYGSRQEVLDPLVSNLQRRLPRLVIAGAEPSKFRTVGREEAGDIARRIRASGARLTFVGLGCPRQEVFVYALRSLIRMPLVAVGAAFDYLAGVLPEPPTRLRRAGLEWLWRLTLEPRRLWHRYLLLNPMYLSLLAGQVLGIWRPDPTGVEPPASALIFG
jgi:N-acetylglucosaminyldiphosphoundecaprenol N-acetyl-beta-D-mannosaminyltransferase